MAVLGPPWDVKLWLYPGGNPAADPGLWGLPEDISTKVRYPGSDGGQPISYAGGRADEYSTVDPGQMNLTLDNTDGRFTPQNAMGLYWPKLDLNTPIRLGVTTINDTFTRTVAAGGLGTADTGNVWSMVTSAANWSVNGSSGQWTSSTANVSNLAIAGSADSLDCDVVATAIPNAVATGSGVLSFGVAVRRTDNSNLLLARLDFNTGSTLTLTLVRVVAGVQTTITDLNPIPALTYSAGQRWRLRAQADGSTIRAKVWLESGSEPTTWHVSGSDTTQTGSGVGAYMARFAGNTNASNQLGFDSFQVVGFEFTGSVAKWPPRWDLSGKNAYAPIQANGILRRLIKPRGALQTPLEHQLPFYNPTGYWTLQDGPAATQFANTVAGGSPATFSNVTPAADSSLAGGSVAPVLKTATGTIRGFTKKLPGGTGFAFMWFAKLQALPAGKTLLGTIRTTGRVQQWMMWIDPTGMYVEGYDADGVKVVNTTATTGSIWLDWVAWQLETEVSGSNTLWAVTLHTVGSTAYGGVSGSYASTAVSGGMIWRLGGSDLNGAAFAHVWLGPNTLPFVTDSFSLVSSGYSGELASDRIARIALQASLPIVVEPGPSEACGPQRTLQPFDEIQTAVAADFGVLYERSNGLGFRPRSGRRNQAVLTALSVASGQLDQAPEPIYDDQRVTNSWKVTRDNGSYAVVSDPVSIAKVGEYPDAVTINVATDDVLIGQGELRTYLGTRPVLRWPSLSLDFARNPSLLAVWRARGFAARITVAVGKTQVAGLDPDVIVEGFACQLDPRRWVAELSCSDATAWDTGVYNDTAWRSVWGPSNSTLTGSVTTTGLSLTVDGGGETWRTGAVTFLLNIDGEWISVNNISGTGPYTFTVAARSVNGVVKTHASGAVVTFAKPAKYAY